MDELPPHARDLLQLVRAAHDCDDQDARLRVRKAVANAVGAGGLESALQTPRAARVRAMFSWPLAGLASKWSVTALLAAATLGLTLTQLDRRAADEEQLPTGAPRAPSATAHVPDLSEPAELRSSAQMAPAATEPRARANPERADHAKERTHPVASESLAREIALLTRVEHALVRRDADTARRLLARHRARFAEPALGQEREAYEVLLRCLLRDQAAAARAHDFLRRYPNALLAARVRVQCPSR